MEIRFEEYHNIDRDATLDMMEEFNKIDNYSFDRKISKEVLDEFVNTKSLGRLYLIKNQNDVIGYVVLTFGFSFEYKGRDAFIDELYIKQVYRNQGIGKTTLDFIESESKRLHVNAAHLEVEPHNKNANKLYVAKGYRSNNRILLTKKIMDCK